VRDDEFDRVFAEVYPRLVALALAMSAPRSVAEELAQGTMLRAYRERHRLDHQPLPWCRKVMSNLLIDAHRSRTAEASAIARAGARGEGPAARTLNPADAAVATPWTDLIAPLTPRQRLVATLYYAEDQSIDAIAEELAIGRGTVKSTLSKVRTNLRHAHAGPREEHGRRSRS